eukprot:80360-Pleurochrysis_carterae.AAC.1
MNGIGPCSTILDDATVATLQGSSTLEPNCQWVDDTQLKVYLTMFTAASAGMRVGLRPNVIWPRLWRYPSDCGNNPCTCSSAGESFCTDASEMLVDRDFPCDRQDTTELEYCIPPQALIQAPEEIGICPGTAMTLDASASTKAPGAGIKPLKFRFVADVTACDNYAQISSR